MRPEYPCTCLPHVNDDEPCLGCQRNAAQTVYEELRTRGRLVPLLLPGLTPFSGTISGTWNPEAGTWTSPLSPLCNIPVRLDPTLCDPGEVWLTYRDGSVRRLWPPSPEDPDA